MPLIMLCASLRKLRFIAPLSTLANFALITGVITIMYYSCSDVSANNVRYAYENLSDLPTMFGIIMFSFEGIGLVNILFKLYLLIILNYILRLHIYMQIKISYISINMTGILNEYIYFKNKMNIRVILYTKMLKI